MLVGKSNHTLDAKGRLFVPARYKDILGDKFMITKNVDNCLSIYSMEEWEKYTARISELPKIQAREIRRFVYSGAAVVEPDGQGRVAIPEDLREFACIDREVVILGCGEYAEIWSLEARLAEETAEKTDSILEMMLEAGL